MQAVTAAICALEFTSQTRGEPSAPVSRSTPANCEETAAFHRQRRLFFGRRIRLPFPARADIGPEIGFGMPPHGGHRPAVHNINTDIRPRAGLHKLLTEEGTRRHMIAKRPQFRAAADQIDLSAKGTVALLHHHREAETFLRPLQEKSGRPFVHVEIGHGCNQCAGHRHAFRRQAELGSGLVVADRDRLRRIIQPHSQRFQRASQPHILVPEQSKIAGVKTGDRDAL